MGSTIVQTDNLTSLFLEHASGGVTRRALEERKVRILVYMSANKYTMKEETFKELQGELDEIGQLLEDK